MEKFFHPKVAEHHHLLPHADYTLVTVPAASKEDLKTIIQKYDGIKTVTWDGSKTLIPEVGELEKYDLIFLSGTFTNLIPQAAHILESGGNLVVVDATALSSQPDVHNEALIDQLRRYLDENGLSLKEFL